MKAGTGEVEACSHWFLMFYVKREGRKVGQGQDGSCTLWATTEMAQRGYSS